MPEKTTKRYNIEETRSKRTQKPLFHQVLFLLAALAALLPYATRLVFRSISIDTEMMINTPERILTSWLYHERPGLVVSKYLFGQTTFHYEVAIAGAAILLMAACLVWNHIMSASVVERQRASSACSVNAAAGGERGKAERFAWIFPLLFLTHPVMTEQFHFALQSMEVAWALLLCLMAAGMVSKGLWQMRDAKGKGLAYLSVGIAAMLWSFSSYQALVAVYIAAAAGLYLLQFTKAGGEGTEESFCVSTDDCRVNSSRFWWRLAILQVVCFLIGFLLSRGAAKIGLYISTGSTESTAYVAGMVKWGTQPFLQCVKDLYHYGMQIVTGQGVFYTLAYSAALIGTLIVVLIRFPREHHRPGYAAYLLAGVILYVSPFLLPLYAGGPDQARAQIALAFVIAFGWYDLISLLALPQCGGRRGQKMQEETAEKETVSRKPILIAAACILACFFAAIQYVQSIRLTFTAYQTYVQEYALTGELVEAVEATGAPEGAKVQFVGRWSPQMTRGMVRGETIGYSFYEWDAEKAYGSTERILGLWRTLGYEYEPVDLVAAPDGTARAKDKPCWPEAGSVTWDGSTVLIKLSE